MAHQPAKRQASALPAVRRGAETGAATAICQSMRLSERQNPVEQKPPRHPGFPRTTAAAGRRALLPHRHARRPASAAALRGAVAWVESGLYPQRRRPAGCRFFIAEISAHPAVPPLSFARQPLAARPGDRSAVRRQHAQFWHYRPRSLYFSASGLAGYSAG